MSIGKYHLKIGGTTYGRVSYQEAYKIPRVEQRVQSFSGAVCVDRSALKYKVTSTIALLTESEKDTLVASASNGSATCEFYDGDTLQTKTCIVSMPVIPSPTYKYGNRASGVYYLGVQVDLEEV